MHASLSSILIGAWIRRAFNHRPQRRDSRFSQEARELSRRDIGSHHTSEANCPVQTFRIDDIGNLIDEILNVGILTVPFVCVAQCLGLLTISC